MQGGFTCCYTQCCSSRGFCSIAYVMVPTSYTVWMCRHKVVPQGGFTCCCTQCRSRQNPISIVYRHVAVGGLPTAVPGVWRSGDKTVHTQWIYRYIQCVFWAEHRLFNYFSLSLVKTVTYSCTLGVWGSGDKLSTADHVYSLLTTERQLYLSFRSRVL